jgi:hypothetical protein
MDIKRERVLETFAAWESGSSQKQRNTSSQALAEAITDYRYWAQSREDGGALLANVLWPKVLKYHGKGRLGRQLKYAVLQGMLDMDGWRILFERSDTARAFVLSAIRYIETSAGPDQSNADALIIAIERTMPAWSSNEGLSRACMRPLAAALFGEPWCVMVFDESAVMDKLSTLIMTTQPEFLPGLITSKLEHAVLELPQMTC